MPVTLCEPSVADKTVILNLLPFYRYDLSPFIESEGQGMNRWGVFSDGNATTHAEEAEGDEIWWSKPGVLWAFLFRVAEEPAGFALVASPPYTSPGTDYELIEFWVRNTYRRQGVGSEMATQLFDRLPGRWQLAYLRRNTPAQTFWTRLLRARYRDGVSAKPLASSGRQHPGFAFVSPPPV